MRRRPLARTGRYAQQAARHSTPPIIVPMIGIHRRPVSRGIPLGRDLPHNKPSSGQSAQVCRSSGVSSRLAGDVILTVKSSSSESPLPVELRGLQSRSSPTISPFVTHDRSMRRKPKRYIGKVSRGKHDGAKAGLRPRLRGDASVLAVQGWEDPRRRCC